MIAADITIHGDKPGAAISPTLDGIFYEDINYAGDGGLYAELVQNRSFEYRLMKPGKFSMRNPKTPLPPLFASLAAGKPASPIPATTAASRCRPGRFTTSRCMPAGPPGRPLR